MNLNLWKALKRSFGIKVFVVFAVFISVVTFSFTSLFVHHQGNMLRQDLIKNGNLLAMILAHNVRLGVFSENEGMLKDPVEGIFRQEGVQKVSVFNVEGNLLKQLEKPGLKHCKCPVKKDENINGKIIEKLITGKSSFYVEEKCGFEFWSPVISGSGYSGVDDLFDENNPLHGKKGDKRVTGFVRVELNKKILDKQLADILFKSSFAGAVFFVIGSIFTYLMIKMVIRPLKRLIDGVNAVGRGGAVKAVPIEREDEIGDLASAFNNMTKSLQKKEAEKEQLEEHLRHAQKMEAVGTLAGGVAHDFNNILTAIMGYGTLLNMQIDEDSPLKNKVKQILASAEKAANLTRNLLAFSRKQIIKTRPLNLNDSIENIKSLAARLIRENIKIDLKLCKEDLIIMADSGQLDQVLMNLATNASDAIAEDGVITAVTEAVELDARFFKGKGEVKSGRYALLSVIDNGMGMDEKTRERIFEPFFTTKNVGKGTGLGLSMIYGIIKQHGGYIDVDSAPGKGTIFKTYLPLVDAEIEKEETKVLHLSGRGTETVLLAEDDDSVRALSKQVLEESGYKVIEAADGEDAVKKFVKNRKKIDVLLFDVIMPKKSGKKAYEEIAKLKPGIKALFMSGYTSGIFDGKEIVKDEINIISKPVSPGKLLSKLRQTLGNGTDL